MGPLNIGNPNEITIRALADLIIELTGSKSKLSFKALPSDDPVQRKPEISKARENLGGWEPAVSLKEGIEKTIPYFEGLLQGKNSSHHSWPA